jgi:hypothetical protein
VGAGSRRWRIALLVAGASLLGGCSWGDTDGMTLDAATGRPALLTGLCEDGVQDVLLRAGAFGEVLWHIATDEPAKLDVVVVGEVPDGYREVVPLASELPDLMTITAMTSDGYTIEEEFRPSDLEIDVVVMSDAVMSIDDFRADVDARCDDRMFGVVSLPGWADVAILGTFAAGATAAVWFSVRRTRL